eukprot:CAMPEP_0176502378 /NCGR_PEP_ID=MMETSP0200_2-20121128/14717_1 /TAXON_ID=947934 /ORGANISM="Chaetoceros sp., Strain GSL56" /LENGTH=748 /DNA_ID=CAMNT_0017901437 /DNA_START=1754 /DNA_END=3997 /DNA_ORIENTATION=-
MNITNQFVRIFLVSSLLSFLKVQSFGPSFQKTFTRTRPSKFFTAYSQEEGRLTFDSLTVAQLKDELRSRGLKITGKKEELIERLESNGMTTDATTTASTATTTTNGSNHEDVNMVHEEVVTSQGSSDDTPQMRHSTSLSDDVTFHDLGIMPQLLTSIEFQGWEEPTPIQKLAVPEILKAFQQDARSDGDGVPSIWAEAPTGSGKTGAFAIPIIQLTMENRKKDWNRRNANIMDDDFNQERQTPTQVNLLGRGRRFSNEKSRDAQAAAVAAKGFVSTLILCPTRELAVQIGGVIEELVEAMPTKQKDDVDVVVITGGVPMEPQIQMLAERKRSNRDVDILIATPGRLADVLSRSSKEDTVEKELETKLLEALDMVGGKKDATLSLAKIEKMEINKRLAAKDDGGRSAIQDMLSRVKYLVLDEADRLLSQGFKAEMDEVLNLLPSASTKKNNNIRRSSKGRSFKLKTLLFSATFPEQIQPRVENVLQRLNGKDAPPPLRLSCSSPGYTIDSATIIGEDGGVVSNRKQKRLNKTTQPQIVFEGPASTIDLRTIRIEERDRTIALRRLIDQYGEVEWDRVLVFVGTRYAAEHVARKLRRYNIKASELHGKLDQEARVRRLEDFKKGKIRVLIATDLASRGLDVQGLPVVVNYDLPRSTADFTHRVGRTGRAGNKGMAVTFVTPTNEAHYDLIEKRHFGGTNALKKREVLPGFEPDESRWEVARSASTIEVEGVQHSDSGLAHDRMFGGVKGR